MKKILSIIIFILLATPTWSWAVTNTFTVVSGNNWSTTANWSEGHAPTTGEDVVISGAVTWDSGENIPASGSLGTITGTYAITLDMDAVCTTHVTGCTLTATTITAGTVAYLMVINGSAQTDHVLTINADIVGGSTSSDTTVQMNGVGTINATGNVTGGSAAQAHGIEINKGTYNIGGSGKVIKGGASYTGYGIFVASSVAGTGTITGTLGSTTAVGPALVSLDSGGTLTYVGDTIINGTGGAISGYWPIWNPATTGYIQAPRTGEATAKFYYDIPTVSNVLPADTVAGVTGEAVTSGGGSWGF